MRRPITHIARTRKILSGWKDTSTAQDPQRQECPECGVPVFSYWAASLHQTWHISLARALHFALQSSDEGRAYLAEFLGEDASGAPSASASASASAGGAGAGSYDSMTGDPEGKD